MPRAPKIEYQKADRRLYVPCRSCGGTGRCRTCNGTGDRGDTKTATKQQCTGNVQVVEVQADVTYVEVLENIPLEL